MSFEGAFQCSKCPKSNDPEAPRACPAWWETIWTNKETNDVKVEKGCAFRQLQPYVIEMIKAAAGASEMGSHVRNDLNEVRREFGGQLNLIQCSFTNQFKRPGIGTSIAYTYNQAQPAISPNKPSHQLTDDSCGVGSGETS